MHEPGFCAGCSPEPPADACRESFSRREILKVHWECWSDCNLACGFCYRSRGLPIGTDDAHRLLEAVHSGGARAIVFAGGDPSIRPDIAKLISYAHHLGLMVEVQTNAHHVTPEFMAALETVHMVGLSLDGPNATIHDSFRDKPGNFDRVTRLLDRLNELGTPVILRSIAARSNHASLVHLAALVVKWETICRWSIMEFSPFEQGFVNRDKYVLDSTAFDKTVENIMSQYKGRAELDIYRRELKVGTYAQITPDGHMFTTCFESANGSHASVGSILIDHLSELSKRLGFNEMNHHRRYKYVLQMMGNANTRFL